MAVRWSDDLPRTIGQLLNDFHRLSAVSWLLESEMVSAWVYVQSGRHGPLPWTGLRRSGLRSSFAQTLQPAKDGQHKLAVRRGGKAPILKPTRHHVAGADNHAPSSIWRAINGFRTPPSGRDPIRASDQDAAPLVRLRVANDLN